MLTEYIIPFTKHIFNSYSNKKKVIINKKALRSLKTFLINLYKLRNYISDPWNSRKDIIKY